MPTLHYNAGITLGQMVALGQMLTRDDRLGEPASFEGTIKSASREELSEKEWKALDLLVETHVREALQYEVRKPLVIRFSEIRGTSSRLVITNPADIKRVYEDYGVGGAVSTPEGYIKGNVVVYVMFPAEVDNKNKGDIVAFSRRE